MICVAFGGGGVVVSVVSVLCGAGGGLTVQAETTSTNAPATALTRRRVVGTMFRVSAPLRGLSDHQRPREGAAGSARRRHGRHSGYRPGDGAVVQFRDNVLWNATDQTRTAVANALDVDPSLPHTSMLASISAAAKQSLRAGNGNVGKFTPGSPNAVGANKTDSPRPVATAVKAINNQLKETAEHLGRPPRS